MKKFLRNLRMIPKVSVTRENPLIEKATDGDKKGHWAIHKCGLPMRASWDLGFVWEREGEGVKGVSTNRIAWKY